MSDLGHDAEGRKHEDETGIDVNSRADRDPATIMSRKMRDGVSGLQRQVRVRSAAVLSTVGTTDAYLLLFSGKGSNPPSTAKVRQGCLYTAKQTNVIHNISLTLTAPFYFFLL